MELIVIKEQELGVDGINHVIGVVDSMDRVDDMLMAYYGGAYEVVSYTTFNEAQAVKKLKVLEYNEDFYMADIYMVKYKLNEI